MSEQLTVGSLFSGIGGLDLGLERAGMRVIWQSEIDPYASKVLAKHWPDVPNLGDITKIDWSAVERPDLVCGGYPCQPFSHAGRRGGTTDARHLWPFFADALRLLRPRWALLENVPGHLGLGFADVLADLAALGFDAGWELLPAAAFGAPHLRYRLFVVAHADGEPVRMRPRALDAPAETPQGGEAQRQRVRADVGDGGPRTNHVAGVDGTGPQGHRRPVPGTGERPTTTGGVLGDTHEIGRDGRARIFGAGRWRQPENSGQWLTEPDVGRVAHGIPHRVDRLKCLGNAVVPQVAQYVGERILERIR